MAEKKTRFCTYHQCRHPESEFGPGDQNVCKAGRVEQQAKMIAENRKIKKDPEYKKYCKKCQRTLLAKDNFKLDASRPDGYFLYCKECSSAVRAGRLVDFSEGICSEFSKKLKDIIVRVVKDQDRSIVRQLVEDFYHEGQPVSFTGREWQIQIINDLSPNVVCRKRSQAGLTWALERFVMCLLFRYNQKPYTYKDHTGAEKNRFLVGIYSFETKEKASNWSKIRLEKLKRDNPFIQDALKMGKTDAALLMQLGRTSLHLVGRSTAPGVTSIDADIVIIDEKDRDQRPEIATQISSRLLESEFMNTPSSKGICRTVSTPEVSGAGISLHYDDSTQNEWEIMCVKCGTWFVPSYPECIGNFYERGDDPPIDDEGDFLKPYWRCQHCHEPIDWSTIGQWDPSDPDHYVNCRWVERKPENYDSKTGRGIVGYQVPFVSVQRSAAFFLKERDDPEHDETYLHNHLLGLPYDDVAKTLVPSNFAMESHPGWGFSGKGLYVMGCDHHPAQGGFIVIWKQIPDTVTATMPTGKWTVVYLEHVPDNAALWDSVTEDKQEKKGRLYELILEYGIEILVVDVEPDTNEVERLIKEFSFTKTVWSNRSGRFQDTFKLVEDEIIDEREEPVCRIFEDKVAAIDWYFNLIRFGHVRFLDSNAGAPDKLMDQFLKSHTNLYKGEIEQSSVAGAVRNTMAALNIKEIYKKRVARIGDHWTMASKFCCQATRVFVQANRAHQSIFAPSVKGMGRIPGT